MGWEEELGKVVLAAIGAAVVALIGYVVVKKITSSNLAEYIQNAVARAKNAALGWMYKKKLKAYVKNILGNTVTVSLTELEAIDKPHVAEISIKSVMGVDMSSVKVGDQYDVLIEDVG